MWTTSVEVVAVILFVLFCLGAWCATLVSLPGNWAMVIAAALMAWLAKDGSRIDIQWWTVGVLAALAGVGELLETAAGAAGTAKLGGSRRGMVLSIVGAIIGSAAGVAAGLPIPVIGSAIAAVFGGAMGAFAGAVAGEHWKGADVDKQMAVGRAAFMGRLVGTAAKLIVGAVIAVIAIAAVLLDF
ncbi:MAG: DUF456 domain-containing protein [Planctomycetales bacterium]|nr:DUF456 domain-containing protein [Planctomycetales bacterium]